MKKMSAACLWAIFAVLLLPAFSVAQKIADEDVATAQTLHTENEDNDYAAVNYTDEYTFDRSRNDLGQPVVTATGEEELEFIALRDIVSFTYVESYNRFVELSKFNLDIKNKNRYVPDHQKAEDRALTDDDIFLDDNRVKYFDISLGKMGQMARVQAEEKYDDSKYLTRVYFHSYFPIRERTIRFVVPQWLNIDFLKENFDGYKISETRELRGRDSVFTFVMKGLDAVKNERHEIGKAYVYPHIIVMVRSYEIGGTTYRGFQTIADLYKWYNFLYSKCRNENAALKTIVSDLVKDKTSNAGKAKAIYYWVQDNIRYIAFENGYAGYIPDAAQNVLKKKYGDCKGMANLLTEMLRIAGLDAHFTWIGTRGIPYDHATTPAMCVDNHAICTLYLDGKTYFLDATESYVPFGENAYRIQGKSALIQNGDKFNLEHVPMSDQDRNRLSTRAKFTMEGETLKGHVQVTFTGNERTDFLQVYHSLPVDRQKEFLKSILEFGNDNLTASSITTSDLKDRELPVVINGDVELDNNVTTAGKDAFVSIDFFPKSLTSYMPDKKRQNGYDFESLFTYDDDIELDIPAGDKFTDIPEAVKENYPGYAFEGSYTASGNAITLRKSISIRKSQVAKKDFPQWTAFLKKMRDFNNNQVSVTKK